MQVADEAPRSARRSPGAGSATWWKCSVGIEARVVLPVRGREREPVGGALAEARRSARRCRSRKIALQRVPVDRLVEPQDALMTIRFVGRSMRSQAASAVDMA